MISAGALSGLAGCSTGDDDPAGTSTPDTDTSTQTDTGETDTDETETDTDESVQVYDVTAVNQGFPLPEDITNYQTRGESDQGQFNDNGSGHYRLFQEANRGGEFIGVLAKDYEYRPGHMTIELHDDFYYWNGDPVDAENIVTHWKLDDYVSGGDDNTSHEETTDVNAVDDYTVEWILDDTYSEDFALSTIFVQWGPTGSTSYYADWLERFENADSQDEIEDLRTEIADTVVEDPEPFFNSAYKPIDATENSFIYELRVDEDPTPHYVDGFKHRYMESRVYTEGARMTQAFADGEQVYDHGSEWTDDEIPFESERVFRASSMSEWGFVFNTSNPPFSNPHFRRAITYMVNQELLARSLEQVEVNKYQTPFKGESQVQQWVSDDMLDQIEDYGWNESRPEEAAREMEAGGFEQDDQGRWLYQEGDQAGEPIELTIHPYNFYSDWWANQIQDFHNQMTDFGIETSSDNAYDALWTDLGEGEHPGISGARWGGGIPAVTMGVNFGDNHSNWTGNPQLPDVVEAPPIGEKWSEYDGELETYETRRLSQQLPVLTDEERIQEIVDELTWVYNQVCPRIGVENDRRSWVINAEKWDVADWEDDIWHNEPQRMLHRAPAITYNPDSGEHEE